MDDLTDDEIARIFRENDNLGDDSSILLRTIRQLVHEGKPPGLITPLQFRLGEKITYPFGALFADKGVISFWPAYPKGTDMAKHFDHVTLDLRNGKSHLTGYDPTGHRYHVQGDGAHWRLHPIDGSAHALWLPLFVKWQMLEQQDSMVQRGFDAGTVANKERLEKFFIDCAAGMQHPIIISLPPTQETEPDYVMCNIHITDGSAPDLGFTGDMFRREFASEVVDGWNDTDPLAIMPMRAVRGGHTFTIAAACPPGSISSAFLIGLPTRRQKSKDVAPNYVTPPFA
jgi:hypothetical protein